MNLLIIAVFLGGLTCCVLCGANLLWALGFGLLLFSAHALHKGHAPRAVLGMWYDGARTVANILVIFLLIGMLTGVWRAAGTIACLIGLALPLVDPHLFALWVFLLCAGLSLLIGTAFGTVSTLGVIFMLLARTAGCNELIVGGAILSGIYVGDRCSPMSSSAALVCAVTETNIYQNIKGMWRTSLVPLAASCLGYWLLARLDAGGVAQTAAMPPLDRVFLLDYRTLAPAAVVAILSCARVEVKKVMLVSILAGCAVCLWVQDMPLAALARSLVDGYAPPEGYALLAGGGLVSMLEAGGIVLLSAPFAALFRATGLMEGLDARIGALGRRLGAFRCMALVSVVMAMISCNQMLTVLLGAQSCRPLYARKRDLAIPLENSAILIPVLIPWNIAGQVPCAAMEVSAGCLLFALYPLLVPLCNAVPLPGRFRA